MKVPHAKTMIGINNHIDLLAGGIPSRQARYMPMLMVMMVNIAIDIPGCFFQNKKSKHQAISTAVQIIRFGCLTTATSSQYEAHHSGYNPTPIKIYHKTSKNYL
jgi:hypothetical protein